MPNYGVSSAVVTASSTSQRKSCHPRLRDLFDQNGIARSRLYRGVRVRMAWSYCWDIGLIPEQGKWITTPSLSRFRRQWQAPVECLSIIYHPQVAQLIYRLDSPRPSLTPTFRTTTTTILRSAWQVAVCHSYQNPRGKPLGRSLHFCKLSHRAPPSNERCSRQARFGCGFAAMVVVCARLSKDALQRTGATKSLGCVWLDLNRAQQNKGVGAGRRVRANSDDQLWSCHAR